MVFLSRKFGTECNAAVDVVYIGSAANCQASSFFTGLLFINAKQSLHKFAVFRCFMRLGGLRDGKIKAGYGKTLF